jgi:hypothetical protein
MKLFTLLCLLTVCLLSTTGVSLEDKNAAPATKDGIKYEMDDLGKNFGIKFKAAKLEQPKTEGDTLITMTLEFTKDVKVSRLSPRESLESLRGLFAGKEVNLGEGVAKKNFKLFLLKCYFFDEDGVAFTTQPPGKIDGEVSGKKGDAFRITQNVPGAVFAKTKKISFREEPVKKKE